MKPLKCYALADEIKVGSRWTYGSRTLRVMAVAEGYVMYRFKGCGVDVIYWKDFLKKFTGQQPTHQEPEVQS